VPQGGNTGLVGGAGPAQRRDGALAQRLDRIREVDPVSNTITCEAGVTLQRAREAAAAVDRLYPQLLPSEGTCTIGGNLSTNAGGTAALAHGVARSHALGLEVVLADGRVLNNLNKLKKDNTGYDLKNLFIGAEGTLGIITAAVLRLVPRPRSVETAWASRPLGAGRGRSAGARHRDAGGRRHQLRTDVARRHRMSAFASGGTRDPLDARIPGTC
jgi:FAD/FMN-containing dehydrogenase